MSISHSKLLPICINPNVQISSKFATFFFATFFSLLETEFKKCNFFFGNTSYNESFFCNVTPCILSFFFVKLFLFLERERNQTRFVFFAFKKKLKKKKREILEKMEFFLRDFLVTFFFFLVECYFVLFLPGRKKNPLS